MMKTENDNALVHTHEFKDIVRKKGNNVRYKCSGCGRIGPWVKFYNPSLVGEASDLTSNYYDMTVPALRSLCKERGIRGVSSAPKAKLVMVLEAAG